MGEKRESRIERTATDAVEEQGDGPVVTFIGGEKKAKMSQEEASQYCVAAGCSGGRNGKPRRRVHGSHFCPDHNENGNAVSTSLDEITRELRKRNDALQAHLDEGPQPAPFIPDFTPSKRDR